MNVLPQETGGVLGFTILDLIVIIIIVLGIYIGYKKGFFYALFKLINIMGSLFISTMLYPIFSRFLIRTDWYINLTNNIISQIGLSSIVEEALSAQQDNIINSLPIPKVLANTISNNINLQSSNILDISGIEQQLGNFIATIIINIISFIVVFILASITLKVILKSLNTIVKLPIINSFNNILGAIIGFVWSLIFIWLGLIIYPLSFINGESNLGLDLLYSSSITLILYERNPLLLIMLGIFS